ncbi:hypothetical protein [Lacinutrix undariae]
MKQSTKYKVQLKQLTKLFIMVFTLTFMNCQKEDIQKESSTNVEDTNSTSDIKGLIIKTDSVFIANNFLREQISSKFSTTNNSNARTITSSTYGFSIDTTRVQVLASYTFESYTFVIERDEPNNDILENYILTRFNDGSFSQMLLSYPIVTIDGNFSYDISNINGQYINDISLLTARSSPCSWSGDEVMAWDPNGGDCIEFSCGGATGNGKHGYGQSGCKAQGDDRASQRCTGAYVAIDCIFGGPGSSTGTTNPGGGTTKDPIPDPIPEPTPVPVVPFEVSLESAILNFLYGYNMEFLNQNYDNTPVREEMLQNLTDEQKQSIYNYTRKFGISDADKKVKIEEYVKLGENIPDVKFNRYIELDSLLANNPAALIQDCAEQNGLNTQNYLDLYNLPFPQECSDRLFNMGVEWHHQPITDGNVPIANIDYYGVEVTNYPDFNNDGNSDSEAEMYQAFREKFIDIASGEVDNFQFSCNIPLNSTNTGNIDWEFIPLTNQDGIDFISNNPITSILLIEADANGFFPSIATDDGAVMVSNFTNNDWTISTIMTANNGTQPFSGNRQWGWLINQNGNFEFFTRAVDVANISKILNIGANTECQQDTYYDIAEATWENMQQEIVNWINSSESNGGQANIIPKKAVRCDKELIEELLTSNETINQINCN